MCLSPGYIDEVDGCDELGSNGFEWESEAEDSVELRGERSKEVLR